MTASIHSAPLVFSAEFTPLGWIGAVATGQGLCWVAFGADPLSLRAHARRTFQPTALIEDAQAIESLMTPIRSYLHMQSRTLEVPFDTRASAFCETVWGGAAPYSLWTDAQLYGDCRSDRRAAGRARGRERLREKSARADYALPSRDSEEWPTGRLSLGRGAQSRASSA